VFNQKKDYTLPALEAQCTTEVPRKQLNGYTIQILKSECSTNKKKKKQKAYSWHSILFG